MVLTREAYGPAVDAILGLPPVETLPVTVLPPADVLETLATTDPVQTVILDPWYNRGVGGERVDYDDWLAAVVHAACRVANHVFLWGFPERVARQLDSIPTDFRLFAWLTWYYKNCPSVIRGWRPAQNACLHFGRRDAPVYPEHFMDAAQRERLENGRLRFIPGPPSVLEVPLNVGFVGRDEQTGHPAQKPLAVIEPLVLMSTQAGDIVLDPMCGAGTTGAVCLRTGRRAVLCDHSPEYITLTQERIEAYNGSW